MNNMSIAAFAVLFIFLLYFSPFRWLWWLRFEPFTVCSLELVVYCCQLARSKILNELASLIVRVCGSADDFHTFQRLVAKWTFAVCVSFPRLPFDVPNVAHAIQQPSHRKLWPLNRFWLFRFTSINRFNRILLAFFQAAPALLPCMQNGMWSSSLPFAASRHSYLLSSAHGTRNENASTSKT